MPKPSGVTFNRYAAIAGRILRKSLKEDARLAAERQDFLELKMQKWDSGKASEAQYLKVPLKK